MPNSPPTPQPLSSAEIAEAAPRYSRGWRNAKGTQLDMWIEKVVGEIPKDLRGTFIRNGPGVHEVYGEELKHPIDGDGLVVALAFVNGKAHLRSRPDAVSWPDGLGAKESKAPRQVHDFLLTPDYYVVHMTPFVSLEDFKYTNKAPGLLMRFHPGLPSRLVVIPRNSGTGEPVRQFDIQPCHIYHFAHCNQKRCFHNSDEVTLEISALCLPEEFTMEFKDKLFLSNSNDAPGQMYSFTLSFFRSDTSTKVHSVGDGGIRRLGGSMCGEFPTVHPWSHVTPASNRFIYVMGNVSKRLPFNSIIKIDRQSPEVPISVWTSPPGCTVGEPVFCPKLECKGQVPRTTVEEENGYLAVQVYDSARHSTYFVLLEAADPSKGPVCELHTDTFITNGFHGSWSDELLGLGEPHGKL
ncbi:hypothetical protein FOL47_006784 [Perkinsus chesapeaki]|uniref:Uncharacterized protein n=1 Tax=Perkinsus chesapeaki TaxID=330153 RepID=A0A7J6LPH8_PERCH|nr:hypothetical protein FOL47_006784 [Perkinsus chesapeaki]